MTHFYQVQKTVFKATPDAKFSVPSKAKVSFKAFLIGVIYRKFECNSFDVLHPKISTNALN